MKEYIKKRELAFLAVVFLLYIMRYALYGFEYYPILDDYIQHWWYPNMESVKSVFVDIGTLSTRPLAGIFDVYFWARLYKMPFVLVIVNSFMCVGFVYFLSHILDEMKIKTGIILYMVLLFEPITFETQYWISASSRVMAGAFFAVLGLRTFALYIKSGKKIYAVVYVVLNLASMCFYEQSMIFSFILSVAYFYRVGRKKAYIIPIANAMIVAIYYYIFKNTGALANRANVGGSDFKAHILFMIDEIKTVFWQGFYELKINGFLRGMNVLKEKWIVSILCVILSICASALRPKRKKAAKDIFVWFFALSIAIAPIMLLFITDGTYLSYRTAYISLIGIAIMLDRAAAHINIGKAASFGLAAFMLFVLSCGCISEMTDYRQTYINDRKICEQIASYIDESVVNGERKCVVRGAKRSYIKTNAEHTEHIISVTSSDWALTGAVRYYRGSYVPMIELGDDKYESSGDLVLKIDDDLNVSEVGGL